MKIKSICIVALIFVLFGFSQKQCPDYGDAPAKDTKYRRLNKNKNRRRVPDPADINHKVSIASLLSSGDNETLFSQTMAATIKGYLYFARPEGPESCNCKSKYAGDHDIHVFIAPRKNCRGYGECVVVEITPWVKQTHPEWTMAELKAHFGRPVTITGWLLFDYKHTNVSLASHHDLDKPERGTVWELHPITSMKFN